jgi:hypothetical protein
MVAFFMDLNNKKSKSKTVIASISVLLLYHTFIGEECTVSLLSYKSLQQQKFFIKAAFVTWRVAGVMLVRFLAPRAALCTISFFSPSCMPFRPAIALQSKKE